MITSMPCSLQERDRCPDRRRPEGDRVHVWRDGVEQHLGEGRGAVLVAGSVVDKEGERISGCITEVTLGADLGQSVVWIV